MNINKSSKKTHPLYSLIYTATDNYLSAEDEDLNKQICSEILRSPEAPKIAAKIINKIINKSLSGHCYQSIWYCLLLLDVAVKSTDSKFCAAILTKEFLNDLMKIVDSKYSTPDFVQEKFLYILKEWYKSLSTVIGYSNLSKCYKSLQHPQFRVDMPTSNQPLYPTNKLVTFNTSSPIPPTFDFKDKIIHDIDIIETNLTIFSDTLSSLNPETSSTKEMQFLEELYETGLKMQERINEILPYITWEDIINQLIQVNDKILFVTKKYKRLLKNKSAHTLSPRSRQVSDGVNDDVYDVPNFPKRAPNQILPEIYDTDSELKNLTNKELPEIYAQGSLPSYSEAVSARSKKSKLNEEPNLISFEDEDDAFSYRNKPLPSIPSENENAQNLHRGASRNSGLSSREFDEFIDLIARRPPVPLTEPLDEVYAPPLYDKVDSKSSK